MPDKKKQPRCKHCNFVVRKLPDGTFGHKKKTHWTDAPHRAEVTRDDANLS